MKVARPWLRLPSRCCLLPNTSAKRSFNFSAVIRSPPLIPSPSLPAPRPSSWCMIVQIRKLFRPSLDSRKLRSMSLLEMKKFLRSKSIEFSESHSCISILVPKHLAETEHIIDLNWASVDSSLVTFYINKVTGGYVCPELTLAGDWSALKDFLIAYSKNRALKKGEVPEPIPALNKISLRLAEETKSIWSEAKPIEALGPQEFKDLLKRFNLKNCDLRQEDFTVHHIRVDQKSKGGWRLLFPVRYPHSGKLVGLRCVTLDAETREITEENIPDERELNSASTDTRLFPFLYGCDECLKVRAKRVIVVSNVLDALVLRSKSKTRLPVISLSAGVSSLPPEHLPYFEDFAEMIFWFPDDPNSTDAVDTFSKKLGASRCLTIGREVPQPSVYYNNRKQQPLDLHTALKMARPCLHESITTFDSLREDVFLELAHYEEVEGTKFKRFDQINEIMRGFRRGELTVFTGRTGSGKTTFMSEYSLDLCQQNVNTLWGSFEVKNVRLAKMQLKQFAGVNLEDQLESFDEYADRFSRLPMFYLTFHGAQDIEKVLDAMGHAVYVYDIAHVIIDNLQFMMGSSNMRSMDRFYVQDMIIHKFRKFATLHNVHLTLVIHPRKEDDERLTANSIFGGAKATQEADNVLLLQEEEVNARVKRKYIQIVKNRFSGDLGIVPLFFNRSTVTFSKKIYLRERAASKSSSAQKKTGTSTVKIVGKSSTVDRGIEKATEAGD